MSGSFEGRDGPAVQARSFLPAFQVWWRAASSNARTALLGHLYGFCDEFEHAWQASEAFGKAVGPLSASRMLLCGMGGSACAGDIAAGLSVTMNSTLPVRTLRGYTLPASVERESLVLAVSYSGDALSARRCRLSRDAHRRRDRRGGPPAVGRRSRASLLPDPLRGAGPATL